VSFLSDGVTWLATQLREAAGETVGIRRGTIATAGITAVADSVNYEVTDDMGIVQRVRYRDWFIAKTDYKISAVAVVPVPGDRVIGSDATEWELSHVGGRDCYEDWDGITWILHTKRVKA
jgi:hypothetical protein